MMDLASHETTALIKKGWGKKILKSKVQRKLDSTLKVSLLQVPEKAALPFNDSVITMSMSG